MRKTNKTPDGIKVYLKDTIFGISIDPDYETAVEQIKRHVDDINFVQIDYDVENVCEFCEAYWTEKLTYFNGGCCDDDLKGEPLCTLNRFEAGVFNV